MTTTVTTTPTALAGKPKAGLARRLGLRNLSGTTTVYLGDANVTATTGVPLPPGHAIDLATGTPLFAVVAADTADLSVEQENR